jgi:hypothetical protein
VLSISHFAACPHRNVEEGRADRARERRGAVTALITIEGFRDAVEIGYEHRFEEHPGCPCRLLLGQLRLIERPLGSISPRQANNITWSAFFRLRRPCGLLRNGLDIHGLLATEIGRDVEGHLLLLP